MHHADCPLIRKFLWGLFHNQVFLRFSFKSLVFEAFLCSYLGINSDPKQWWTSLSWITYERFYFYNSPFVSWILHLSVFICSAADCFYSFFSPVFSSWISFFYKATSASAFGIPPLRCKVLHSFSRRVLLNTEDKSHVLYLFFQLMPGWHLIIQLGWETASIFSSYC